jgi:hypothetical protein
MQISLQVLKQKAEIRLNISDLLNQHTIIYSNNVNRSPQGGYPLELDNNDPKGSLYNPALDFVTYKVKKGTSFSLSINYKLF